MPNAQAAFALLQDAAAQAPQQAPLPVPTVVQAGAMLAQRILQRDLTCSVHGAVKERGFRAALAGPDEDGRVHWTGCPECAREAERARVAEAEREARAAASDAQRRRETEALRDRIGVANIPRSLLSKTWGNYRTPTPGHRRALLAVKSYADSFDNGVLASGAWLTLIGPTGTGKGHLCGALMQSVVEHHSVQYTTVQDIVGMVRDTWRKGSAMSQMQMVMHLGHDIELLVIDELGQWSGTDSERGILEHVLDHRYRNLRPTVMASNLGMEALQKDLGKRLWSRILERGTVLGMPFGDFRERGAQ